jgi:cyclase
VSYKKMRPRVMPCLLFDNGSLVKTVKFNNSSYVGDPVNAIKIFNEKEVDELIFLDIKASTENNQPSFDIISEIASECFMPLTYGGGVNNIEDMKKIFKIGVEKISLNTEAINNPSLITEASKIFGSQSLIVSIDVKKNFWGKYEVYSKKLGKALKINPVEFAIKMEQYGAGEILLTSVDREGTWDGFDLNLIKSITSVVNIPVIACGGAGKLKDISDAVHIGGASAVAIGSMAVYQKKNLGVLINFPKEKDLDFF